MLNLCLPSRDQCLLIDFQRYTMPPSIYNNKCIDIYYLMNIPKRRKSYHRKWHNLVNIKKCVDTAQVKNLKKVTTDLNCYMLFISNKLSYLN